MSTRAFLDFLEAETKNLRQAGLWRAEMELAAPAGQELVIETGGRKLVNFASSDYLGLSCHADVKKAAMSAIDAWGTGIPSPRMVTGTTALHTRLERAIASLLGTGDALVYPSAHHANTGLFESLLGDRDYVFCDEMIGASLADGIRLSRARVYGYRNNDMEHLEDRLKRSRNARFRIIATDGVFPLTGRIAALEAIYALAEKYRAVVVVDDSQGLGVLGERGEGTHGSLGLADRIDLVTGSFAAALGGVGGFVAGRTSIIAWLRQKSRSYLTSAALSPGAAAAALKAIELLGPTASYARTTLNDNLKTLGGAMAKSAGFTLPMPHPAISIRIKNAVSAQRLTDFLYRKGMFVMGYCHPVVPEDDARISVRVSARHDAQQLEDLAQAFGEGMKTLMIPF